jgi:hypothetical protein
MSLKQEAIQAILTLPEDVNLEEIMYRLYVLNKIHAGQEAIKTGKNKSVDELKKEIENW